MPAYDYKGIIGEKNTYTDGIIEAINEDEAAFRLREQKIIIISLSKSKKKSASDKTKNKKVPMVERGGNTGTYKRNYKSKVYKCFSFCLRR
mgnify:CR=1 FL=1